ncbi:MAG: hypothetical protein ACWGO1_12200, partial [Anaerolineales bacterium]
GNGNREAYRKKVEAQIGELEGRMKILQSKTQQASADARIKYEQQISEMQEKLADARSQLDELTDASEEAWTKYKSGVDDAVGALQEAVNDSAESIR